MSLDRDEEGYVRQNSLEGENCEDNRGKKGINLLRWRPYRIES